MKPERDKDKNPVQKNTVRKRKRNKFVYAITGTFCLAALVACAFFLPSLLFGLKDRYLWQDIVLEARESVDVTLLSASYETSLYNRMLNFAEGLSAGTEYYVSEQDLEVTEELYKLLLDDGALFQEPLQVLIEGMLVNDFLYDKSFTVESWKQYVIYSDDYAQGLNFIIWYLDIAAVKGEKWEIIMDAETYTLYGIKSERNLLLTQQQTNMLWGLDRSLTLYYYCSRSYYNLPELLIILSYYYEVVSEDELFRYYEELMRNGWVYTESKFNTTVVENIINSRILISSDGNRIVMKIPYGEHYMEFGMEHIPDPAGGNYYFPQLIIGVDAICRLIPEFAESF